MKHALSILVWTLLVLSRAAGPVQAQSELQPRSPLERQHRDETRLRYAQTSWASGALRGGLANALELPGWVAGPLQSEQGLLSRSFQRADAPQGAPSFVLETCVTDSVAAAQEHLVIWLAGLQSPQRMPSLAEAGLVLGDAGFVGRSGAGPATLAWVAFVRGNVFVRLSACDAPREPELDLGALALQVDQAVTRVPVLRTGALPLRPRIETLSAARQTLVAGEALALELALVDPAQGQPHLEWIVGGPGQGYVERGADGAWILHTSGPGALTLALEVTASNGTFARKELRLDVLDD